MSYSLTGIPASQASRTQTSARQTSPHGRTVAVETGPEQVDTATLSEVVPSRLEPTPVSTIPLHLVLKVPYSMIGQLSEAVVALVKEDEVVGNRWQPKEEASPVLTPTVADATFTRGLKEGQSAWSTYGAVPKHKLPGELQAAPRLYLDRGVVRPGQGLESAVKKFETKWLQEEGETAQLNLTIEVPEADLEKLESSRLAILDRASLEKGRGQDQSFVPDYHQALIGQTAETGGSEVPLLQMSSVEDTLLDAHPDADSQSLQNLIVQSFPVTDNGNHFQLELTASASNLLLQNKVTLDPSTGLLLMNTENGPTLAGTLSAVDGYQQATGETSPANWILTSVKSGLPGIPNRRVTVSAADATLQVAAPEGLSYFKTVVPKPEQDYVVGRDSGTPVTVRFDAKAVEFLEKNGGRVDLENARVVWPDGQDAPVDARSPLQPNAEQQGLLVMGKIPGPLDQAWTYPIPGTPEGVWGKPAAIAFRGSDDGFVPEFLDAFGQSVSLQSSDDLFGFQTTKKVFRKDRLKTLLAAGHHLGAVESDGNPVLFTHSDSSRQGVTFKAPDGDSLLHCKKAFESILGNATEQGMDWEKFGRLVDIFKQEMGMKGSVLDAIARVEQRAAEPETVKLMVSILGSEFEGMDGSALLNAVQEKALRACPLEVVVMPRDKNPSDCCPDSRAQLENAKVEFSRAFVLSVNPLQQALSNSDADVSPPVQRLFVGEELLEPGKPGQATLRHELLHIFEARYAGAEQKAAIQKSYEESKEFASIYGSARIEYFTTVGEEFFGEFGADGPQWVKEQHPRIYELLSRLTGTDPAN